MTLMIFSMMKKIKLTLLLVLCAVALTGCGKEDINKDGGFDRYDSITTADYNGHRYIIYKGYRKGGIAHDPDCPCREKGGKE